MLGHKTLKGDAALCAASPFRGLIQEATAITHNNLKIFTAIDLRFVESRPKRRRNSTNNLGLLS